MTAIFLDPWMLALPQNAMNVDDYLTRLLALSEGCHARVLPLEVSARACEVLELDGLFPLSAELPSFLWPSRADVYRLVGGLIDRLPKIEDRGVIALLIDDSTSVPELQGLVSARQGEHLFELAATSLVLEEAMGYEPHSVLSDSLPDGKIIFSCELAQIEAEFLPVPRLGRYQGEVPSGRSLVSFYESIDTDSLAFAGDIEAALAIAVWRVTAGDLWPIEARGWALGRNLVASASASGLFVNEARMKAFLRAAIRVITSNQNRNTHWLRVDRGASSPQRRRMSDGAMAWRMDIDDELHLHYWVSSRGPEFANIVFHNDFDISE